MKMACHKEEWGLGWATTTATAGSILSRPTTPTKPRTYTITTATERSTTRSFRRDWEPTPSIWDGESGFSISTTTAGRIFLRSEERRVGKECRDREVLFD